MGLPGAAPVLASARSLAYVEGDAIQQCAGDEDRSHRKLQLLRASRSRTSRLREVRHRPRWRWLKTPGAVYLGTAASKTSVRKRETVDDEANWCGRRRPGPLTS
jgi:hypothetical protein